MKYTIIKSMYFDEFIISVNKALAEGWELCGNLVVVDKQPTTNHYQAMTKKED